MNVRGDADPFFYCWMLPQNVPDLKAFTGQPEQSSLPGMQLVRFDRKRKSSLESARPSKLHISDERMAQHMSQLNINSKEEKRDKANVEVDLELEEEKEGEAAGQRLYVCQEMRRLQTDEIIPSSLLERLERPCMAVVLWQPPTNNHQHPYHSLAPVKLPEEEDQQQQQQQQPPPPPPPQQQQQQMLHLQQQLIDIQDLNNNNNNNNNNEDIRDQNNMEMDP